MQISTQSRSQSFWSYALLLICGIVTLVLHSVFAKLHVPLAANAASKTILSFGGIVALLFALFLGAIFAMKRIVQLDSRSRTLSMGLIIGFALLFRLLLLPQTPFLSNDIYRYLWDAQLLERGINPYLYPPAANELASLHDLEIYGKMSHKEVHTVYPPVLQGLFWTGIKLANFFGATPIVGVKALWLLFDIVLILVLARLLIENQIDPRWAVLYAWHPLAVIEVASSGHTDVMGACFLLVALLFLKRERHVLGAIFLALGFLVKFVTVLLLPFIFFFSLHHEQKKHNWRAGAAFVAVIVLAYLPFMSAGENLYSGLSVYSAKWRFNDALFAMLYTPLHALLPDRLVIWLMIPPSWEITAETLMSRRIDLVLLITKAMMAIMFAAVCLRLRQYLRARATVRWPQLALTLLSAFFLLSPTFQPWYMLWILPLLCLINGGVDKTVSGLTKIEHAILPRFKLYLWLLSGTVFLSYWVLHGYWSEGIWREQAWVKWVEYGLPCAAFLLPMKYLRWLRSK